MIVFLSVLIPKASLFLSVCWSDSLNSQEHDDCFTYTSYMFFITCPREFFTWVDSGQLRFVFICSGPLLVGKIDLTMLSLNTMIVHLHFVTCSIFIFDSKYKVTSYVTSWFFSILYEPLQRWTRNIWRLILKVGSWVISGNKRLTKMNLDVPGSGNKQVNYFVWILFLVFSPSLLHSLEMRL